MKRWLVITISVMIGLIIWGCGEDEEGLTVRPYGTEIGDGEGYLVVKTANCLTIGLQVHVDDQYLGLISTDEPALLHIAPGSHDLFIRSNGGIRDSIQYFFWEVEATAAADYIPELFLDCTRADTIR
ncbi:MAG: hypothetical protein GF417_07315 [Candidatus Latescibacteria bacterium]|nr:hypothetical protein [bacterium]MBD3424228.1 hypothetical protein [Candidatus Latescibacterota bacterium]